MISFTRHYTDRSSTAGFQFQFYCDRYTRHSSFLNRTCSSVYLSTFRPNPVGIASTLTQAASHIIGKGYGLGHAGSLLNDLYKSKAWQDAFASAIEEAKPHFSQCGRCSTWVCLEACWNPRSGLCLSCAPDLGNEVASSQAQTAKEQVRSAARNVNWVGDIDMSQARTARCPHCDERRTPGKYCGICGKDMTCARFCRTCGAEMAPDPKLKFCSDCGSKL